MRTPVLSEKRAGHIFGDHGHKEKVASQDLARQRKNEGKGCQRKDLKAGGATVLQEVEKVGKRQDKTA